MDLSTSSTYVGVNPGQTPHMLAYVAKGSPIGVTADTPDIFLVAAAKDGDHQAYSELWRRHSKQILRTILRISRDVADAEDTLHETLLKAYVLIGGFEGRSAFPSWLTRIAINSALMSSRNKRPRYVYSLEGGVDGDDFKLVNAQPISPAFVSGMELPAYWICWMRRERNRRTKMRMRKATPTAPSLPFYSTNRLLVDGLNGLLGLQKAGSLEMR